MGMRLTGVGDQRSSAASAFVPASGRPPRHESTLADAFATVDGSAPVDDLATLRTLGVLIPAWQPTPVLASLVAELAQRGFGCVLVVDDGSDAACAPVFDAVGRWPQVQVLRHRQNQGKGRALKTGMEYLLTACGPLQGLVTADGDGQHLPEDIERVARVLLGSGSRPVLGVRRFGRAVPLRSRIGNGLTRWLFALLSGVDLLDTQTGLRGLPRAVLPSLLALPGERYEYEMASLASLCRAGAEPLEVPIRTVYLQGNRSSHFRPIFDSLRIYGVLLRFGLRRAFATRRGKRPGAPQACKERRASPGYEALPAGRPGAGESGAGA